MTTRDQGLTFRMIVLALVTGLVLPFAGCKKSNDNVAPLSSDPAVVVLQSTSMKPDGTITDEGLQKIQAKAENPNLTVVFFRSTLTDAGLNQLAKFPKLHRVETTGSRVTDKGVEKLKQSLPQVEVIK
jgi:hypothetical protein